MLVLSRGAQDKVLFPKLGISVEILRIANKRVRLGITAPKDVKVVREELLASLFSAESVNISEQVEHELMTKVSSANQLLHLATKQLESDNVADAMRTLSEALRHFDQIENANEPVQPAKSDSSLRRALLVDDDNNERELLAGYLRLTGFEVTEADDGLRALYRLSERVAPDVVLLDMNMPGMDGHSTLQRIRESGIHSRIPVIAVSGSNPEDVGVEIGPLGVDRWYRKPVNPQKLVEQITELLGSAV